MPTAETPTKQAIEQWGLQRTTERIPQLIETLDTDANLRWDAAWALGKIADRTAVPHLIQALNDENPNVRKRVAYSLGEIGDTSILNVLQERQNDSDQYVQQGIEWAIETLSQAETEDERQERLERERQEQLERERQERLERKRQERERQERERIKRIQQTETIVFGSGDSGGDWTNPNLAEETVKMSKLRQLIVYADADSGLIEKFFAYANDHLGSKYLKEHVDVEFHGNSEQFDTNQYNNLNNLCRTIEVHHEEPIQEADVDDEEFTQDDDDDEISQEEIYETTEIIVFGEVGEEFEEQDHILQNSDFEHITANMSSLRQLVVYAETCNTDLLERFFAYAQEHLGSYLQEHVDVTFYGDPEQFDTKLYNNLNNLCRSVDVQQ